MFVPALGTLQGEPGPPAELRFREHLYETFLPRQGTDVILGWGKPTHDRKFWLFLFISFFSMFPYSQAEEPSL